MDGITIVIPVLNEADNILSVVTDLKTLGYEQIIIGIDSKTTDNTKELLDKNRIKSVIANRTGYDPTVNAAVKAIDSMYPNTKYVVFADAGKKYSFENIAKLHQKAQEGFNLVLGVRTDQVNSMLWHQKLGTQLVLLPARLIFKKKILDISPFRLINYELLKKLTMEPKKFRWPTEMLIKTLAINKSVGEVKVASLKRQGVSKVSGSLKNSIKAGLDMFSALKFIYFKA